MCRASTITMIDYYPSSPVPVHPSPEDCMKILQILGDSPIKQQNDSQYNSNNASVRRRRVHFSSEPATVVSESSDALDFADQVWYKRSQINEFKTEARQLVLSTTSTKAYLKDDRLRGLESSTMERRLHRHKTIQCVLSAYKKHMTQEDVAKISRVCATWNTQIAFVQACRDHYTVYPPNQQVKVHGTVAWAKHVLLDLFRKVDSVYSASIRPTP